MKKTISLLLVLVLCFGLCACSADKTAVDRALQGRWTNASGAAVYQFRDGRFACSTIIDTREGTYEISGSKILLHYDNGVEGDLKYKFSNEKLSLENLTKK